MLDYIILNDVDSTGKELPWIDKKLKSGYLSESYERIGMKSKSYRVETCGSYLEFHRYTTNELRLSSANFCKVRLCPLCGWRRQRKIFAQVSKVMDLACESKEYSFLFLTLTVKNVEGEALASQLNQMFKSYDRLCKHRKFKRSVKGWFRALEITRNSKTGEYHPHFHVILMVEKQYFKKSELYICHDEWKSYWKESLDVDYDPRVDVRKFRASSKKSMAKSVSEAAKYTVKDSDYIVESNPDLTDEVVSVLDPCLRGRRLVAFGGELKKLHKQLNLDDAIDGNLASEGSDVRPDLEYVIEIYSWNVGYKNYILERVLDPSTGYAPE